MKFVQREAPGRGGSRLLHDEFHTGDPLKISAPRNHFPLNPLARHSVLIAGGIGVTPIYSMAKYLAATGASWEPHYGSRSRGFCAFHAELKALGPNVHFYFDDAQGPGAIDLATLARQDEADLYCCGPGGMLNAFASAEARFIKPKRYFFSRRDFHGRIRTDRCSVPLLASFLHGAGETSRGSYHHGPVERRGRS